jgi:uncharacterized protein (TIGR02996 family)
MSRDLEKGFLADVVENPGDDTPRLVFADWCEDNGQSDRAEFIRVQLELARLPKWDGARVRLRAREQALLAAHGAAWRAALPAFDGMQWGGFRRGFVAEALLSSFAALRDEAWRRAAPVEAVSVKWPKKGETDGLGILAGLRELRLAGQMVAHADAERLAACPLLTTLTVLDVTRCATGLTGLRHLVTSPHLVRLQALRAADNSLGDGIGAVLGAAPGLAALEELDLSESGDAGYDGEDVFTAAGMAELGAWPGMARVRRLDLSGHDCRHNQLLALLRSPHAAGLKELTLNNNHNYDGWGRLLAEAAEGMELDVLDVSGNAYRHDAGVFADNPRLASLKVLSVSHFHNPDDAEDVLDLASGRFMASLRALHLDGGEGAPDGLRPLLDAAPPLLHTLSLDNAYFQDGPVIELAESPASDGLLELDLRENDLGPAAAEALGASKHLRSLLVLRIGGNRRMGDLGMDMLALSPLGGRLMVLDRGGKR